MLKKIELLAPAQNKECAYGAINFGADSVYIGANLFGARQNAKNSIEDIKEIIEYAHKFGVKIYVTLNTILTDEELVEAQKMVYMLDEIGADGVIIQDMGLLEVDLPPIKLIASTQCDIRSLEKVKFLEKTGFSRVILARELSLDKIREICKNTECEVETFVHGALCVSYSGQCYMSFKNGGRSANRGECAQSCRKKYSLIDGNGKIIAKDKYLLSLKDFCAEKRLEELIDAGVTSFKIEGRLKDANYVKNTVLAYRRALDKIISKRNDIERASVGKISGDFEANLEKGFNRGYTEYFLGGKRGSQGIGGKEGEIFNFNTPKSTGEYVGEVSKCFKNGFEIVTKNGVEIMAQDGFCFIKEGVLTGALVNSVNKTGGNKFEIFPNDLSKMPQKGAKIFRNKDVLFENALKHADIKRKIEAAFEIRGNMAEAFDFEGNRVKIEFKPEEKAKQKEKALNNWETALKKAAGTIFEIKKVEFLSDEIYFLPMSNMNEIRRQALKELENLRLKNYKKEKQGELKIAPYPVREGDYRLNVHNKKAEEFYNKRGCKIVEKSFESGTSTKNKELMRTKHCLRYAFNMCFKKGGRKCELFLIDEKGAKYPLAFDCANCEMVLLSNVTK